MSDASASKVRCAQVWREGLGFCVLQIREKEKKEKKPALIPATMEKWRRPAEPGAEKY